MWAQIESLSQTQIWNDYKFQKISFLFVCFSLKFWIIFFFEKSDALIFWIFFLDLWIIVKIKNLLFNTRTMKLFSRIFVLFCGMIVISLVKGGLTVPLDPEVDPSTLSVAGSGETQVNFDMAASDKRLSEEPRLRRPLLFKRETNVRRPLLFKRNVRLSPPRHRHYFRFDRF